MTIRYLTLNDVLVLHEYAVRRWGGSPGITNLGLLDAALDSDELFQFSLDIASSTLGKDDIAAWLRIHTTRT
jgi:hypothetical protein